MGLVSRLALLATASLAPCQAFAQQALATAPQPAEGAGDEPGDEIIVQATRSGCRVQDEPVRVEVIDHKEVEEKLMMCPGNVAMILSETGGLRVSVTSPAFSTANIEVQGMEGATPFCLPMASRLRRTGLIARAIADPPTDLGQAEGIKGAASALYGPSALGA